MKASRQKKKKKWGGAELRCCENIVSMLGGNEDIKKLQQSNRKVWTVMEQRILLETLKAHLNNLSEESESTQEMARSPLVPISVWMIKIRTGTIAL